MDNHKPADNLVIRSFRVQFDNVTVSTHPDWAQLDAEIKELNGDSTLDFYLNILKTVNHPKVILLFNIIYSMNFHIHLLCLVEKIRVYLSSNSTFNPDTDTEDSVEIFNKTMNLCQLMASKKVDPLLKVAFSKILKNGTWFTSCPIRKGRYYLQHFRIDEENFPSYLPETDFLVQVEPKSGRTSFWNVTLNGRIDKSKALDDFKFFLPWAKRFYDFQGKFQMPGCTNQLRAAQYSQQ
ncbi:uncharacterized protein LOC129576228 [Sitodiplosis mosellana]|uniref:uncharacterized protein LOC129576228 n=1 Tax=Sitodiplosis mosellana TaxID=263140 RepID=UPI0024449AEA|nr:uncharacterized protein LOC129576228 [Sitodiplosis mosellana]